MYVYVVIEFQKISALQPYFVPHSERRDGLCNPRVVSVHATQAEADAEATRLDESDPRAGFEVEYLAARIIGADGAAIPFELYESPADTTVWHSAKEVCATLGISRQLLKKYTLGEVQVRKGKRYEYAPVITGGIRYQLGGKGKEMFLSAEAMARLKEHLAHREEKI